MKVCVILLNVIALLALTGSTLGDGDGEATSQRVCTVKEDGNKNLFVVLSLLAIRCATADGRGIEQLQETRSLEDRKTFFKDVCDKRREIRGCLAGVVEQSELCQDEPHHAILKIFRDLLENSLDSGCVQDGEVIATAATLYNNDDTSTTSRFTSDPFRICMSAGIGRITRLTSQDLKLSSRFFILYREAINIKECFGEIVDGGVLTTSSNMTSILGEVVEKMKCLHPDDGTVVLCTSIDVTLSDTPRLCPIMTEDEKRSPLFELLVESLVSCLDSEGLDDIEKNEDVMRGFVQHVCRKKRIASHCVSDVVAFSAVCLDEGRRKVVEVAADLLENVVNYGCVEDGRSVAYVLFKVLNDTGNTPDQRHVGRECLDVAKSAHEAVGSELNAANVLTFHQRLNVFKGCFINKLRGDNTAVFNAQTFLTLVQSSMKCVDPENGTIVLCETIAQTTPSTGTKACPFVGENENESPKYKMFEEQKGKCLKAMTIEPYPINGFNTIEEFRPFFNRFCQHSLPALKHCLQDLSSNSAACQNQTNHEMLENSAHLFGTTLEGDCQLDGGSSTAMFAFRPMMDIV